MSAAAPTPPPGYAVKSASAPKPDPKLTAETQLALEHAPYAIREWLDIPNIKAYKADAPPNAEASAGGAPPIAGVREGDTNAIQVYRPGNYTTAPDGSQSEQMPIHESAHLFQNIMEKLGKDNFPADDKVDPYKDMRLTSQDLTALRSKGDTLWKHSREGQASILQAYDARQEWLNKKATPEEKRDYMASTGQFEGNGNAEFQQAYGPYLEDWEQARMPKGAYKASVEETPMKSPPIPPPGYTLVSK